MSKVKVTLARYYCNVIPGHNVGSWSPFFSYYFKDSLPSYNVEARTKNHIHSSEFVGVYIVRLPDPVRVLKMTLFCH